MTFHGLLGILYLKLLTENIFFDHFIDTSGLWTIVVESLIQGDTDHKALAVSCGYKRQN